MILKHRVLIILKIWVHWVKQIFQILTHFIIWHQSIILINQSLITDLISKFFKYLEAIKITVADTSFPKFFFLPENSNLIIGKKSYWLFPSKRQVRLKNICSVTIVCLSLVVSNKNGFPWEKGSSWALCSLSVPLTITLQYKAGGALCVFPVYHIEYYEAVTQGWSFDQIITFKKRLITRTASTGIFLTETAFF